MGVPVWCRPTDSWIAPWGTCSFSFVLLLHACLCQILLWKLLLWRSRGRSLDHLIWNGLMIDDPVWLRGRGMAAAALSSGDFPGDFYFRFCTKEEGLEVLPAHREHDHSRISYCEADDRSSTIPIPTRCWLPVFHRLSATWGPCCAWWSDWIVHVHASTWYWGTANYMGMVSENFMFHVWQVGVSISINWLQGISISMPSISLVKLAIRHRTYNQTAEEVMWWFLFQTLLEFKVAEIRDLDIPMSFILSPTNFMQSC